MATDWETVDMEGEGVIATISEDLCVVSVDINGTDTALPFGRKLLYTWGNQCEGDMTNILEEGMPVNVCYKQSGEVLSAITVWIGEKPDLSSGDVEELMDVYTQKGTVERILEDGSFIVRSDMACTVVVKVDAFFRDGCLSQMDQQRTTVGESVMFDAVPRVDGKDPPGAGYQATCAWVGQTPRLANRFRLNIADSSTQELEVLTGDRVFGTVIVIPSDAVAFVYVEDAHEKVMLLRSSFKQKFERLQDAVEVGDRLCMRLRFSYIFFGCRQWFAEKACKYGEDVAQDTWVVQRASSSACVLPADVVSDSYDSDENENVLSSKNNEVLYGDPPLKGIFNFVSKGKTKSLISYGEMKIAAKLSSLYVGDRSKKDKVKILVPNSVVNFEAVLKYPEGKKYKRNLPVITHEALCVWIDRKPSLAEFAGLTRVANFPLPRKDITFYGTVSKFYLPDTALLSATCYPKMQPRKYIIVCLHTSVLVSDSERNKDTKDLISDFVRLGDSLSFNAVQHPECGDFLCAVNVRLGSNIPDKKPSDVERLHNGYSHETNIESDEDVSSPESEETSPLDDRSSNGILRGNASLPDIICGANPNYGDVNATVKTSKMLTNQTFSKNSKILWSDPPLTGVCKYLSVDKPIIVYKNLKVLFIPANFYIDGLHLGTVDDFMSLCKFTKSVKFEGTKTPLKALNQCDISHRTNLVWVGEKPPFSVVAQSVGLVDKEMLAMPEKMFFGVVANYYFPNMAVIKVKKGPVNSVVCLDTESFIVKPPCSSIKGMECISDFVGLQDKLEFKVKIKETCPLILRAYNVRKLTRTEYDAVSNHSYA